MALEPKTQQKADVVTLSFIDFMTALKLPVTFESWYLIAWFTDYVRCGYRAVTLTERFGAVRKMAKRRGMDFPEKGSRGHDMCADAIKGLKKVDPSCTDRATVLGISKIEMCLDDWGITSVDDYATCDPAYCALAVRALMCHCGMMRGVESRSGMRLSDIKAVGTSHVEVLVAERYSEKKGKNVPGRIVILPVSSDRTSAGAAMIAFIDRFHAGATGERVLFFQFSGAKGKRRALKHRPANDKYFLKGLKQSLERVSAFTADKLKKISNHSLRAGGATDFFVSGVTAELIRAQGGWRTFCFLIYVRPQREHRWKVAAQMVQALRAARETE